MRGLAVLALATGCDALLHLERVPDVPKGIVWQGPFTTDNHQIPDDMHTFSAEANKAGDAIVIQTACTTMTQPTDVSVDADGWQFQRITGIVGNGQAWSAAFTAIAPDTVRATFTVHWTGSASPACTSSHELGDDFSGTLRTNDNQTFDDHDQTAGAGDCRGMVRTRHAFDAVWSACTTGSHLTAPGIGYTFGADDGTGDHSELIVTTDPANTTEIVTFTNANPGADYTMTTISIAPAP
jgi:hypothetical protein